MTFLFSSYLILTFLVVLNSLYRLVYHKYDYSLKQSIHEMSKIFGRKSEYIKLLEAVSTREFYGDSTFNVIFVFIIEMLWFLEGMFIPFMLKFYIGLFCINYAFNTIDGKFLIKFGPLLVVKIFYFLTYLFLGFYFLNHYYHYTQLPF